MRDGSTSRTTGFTYDVKYIIGGGERRVDAQHIKSKVLASRQQLGEQRQEEQQRKKEERARAEAEARQLEEERAERKRRARAELANRRAAKAKRVPSLKRQKATCGIDGADPSVKTEQITPGDEQVGDNEDYCIVDEPQCHVDPERATSLRWLRDVLLNRVPRSEAPDEISVNDILKTVADCTDKPEAMSQDQNYHEATITLLHELERANFIMLVEDTVFLV